MDSYSDHASDMDQSSQDAMQANNQNVSPDSGRFNNLHDCMEVARLLSPYHPSTNSLRNPFYLPESSPPQTPTRPQEQVPTPGAPTRVTRQSQSQRNPSESPTPAFRQTLRDEDENEYEECRTALKRVARQLSFLDDYSRSQESQDEIVNESHRHKRSSSTLTPIKSASPPTPQDRGLRKVSTKRRRSDEDADNEDYPIK